jgi:hypothetical protein
MKKLVLSYFLYFISFSAFAQPASILVTYAGNEGNEGFYDVMQLSNGTFIACGYADNLDWIPANVPLTQLSSGNIHNALGTSRYGLIVQFSSNLQNILQVVHYPQGAVEDIRFMKTTSRPGEPTGDLFISGNTSDSYDNDGGYFLARLNNNFVNGVPDAMVWHRNVWAMSYAKTYHPWDVNANSELVHISGDAHGYNWSAVYWLDENGNREVVDKWRSHVKVAGGEWTGTPASSYASGVQALSYSLIAMKSWGRCELRSWNQEDYQLVQGDGNGGLKKGKWPMDVLFDGPCDISAPVADGPGYTGYSNESCCPVYGGSSVMFDRVSGDLYLGMNMKSMGPTGSPDFEPAVMKMSAEGEMQWWSRLYHEITPSGDTMVSIPDQYIDALGLDYSQGIDQPILVVGARAHGNNTENLWEGNTIAANPTATSFQQQFTGTNGDVHISWIGKLNSSDGTLLHSTYMAEMTEATPNIGTPHPDPNLDGWSNPNTGWPNLNTTYMGKNAMRIGADGSVGVIGQGRRTITTADAWQKMVKPTWGGKSCWNYFVRMYDTDLSKPLYSSLVVGAWDTLTQAGGSNVELYGIWKTAGGIVAVGKSTVDAQGVASGNPMPVTQVPSWGGNLPNKEAFVLAYLSAPSLVNPNDGVGAVTSMKSISNDYLSLKPNPARSEVEIRLSRPVIGNSVPQIFDGTGRMVSVPVQSLGDQGFKLQINSLSPGIYWVKYEESIGKLIKF